MLGRWLGLTPEQPAHFLRGFPECPRAAPSRVGDPPGLGRRGGVQGAARGAIREKRYHLSDPGVHHTSSALVLRFLPSGGYGAGGYGLRVITSMTP